MIQRLRQNRLLVFGPILVVCLTGCARPTIDVSGTITFAGKAPNLEGLEIEFLADDGVVVTAPINLDGTYTAKKVPVCEIKVGFLGGMPKGPSRTRMSSKDPDGNPAPPIVDLINHPIPEHLRSPKTSDVTFTVEAGKPNLFNFDITRD